MRKLLALFAVAGFTLVILLFITNPELLDKVWIWAIGFIGYLLLLVEKGIRMVANAFNTDRAHPVTQGSFPSMLTPAFDKLEKEEQKEKKIPEKEKQLTADEIYQPLISDQNLTLLRYRDDGENTLGMLFIGKVFFGFTLEESQKEKQHSGTKRIPEGKYFLGFNRTENKITEEYRVFHPWFEYPLEIKNGGSDQAYFYDANLTQDTKGCVLIADGVIAYSSDKKISHSSIAFEKIYKTVLALLQSGNPLPINFLNENCLERSKIAVKKEADGLINPQAFIRQGEAKENCQIIILPRFTL